MLRPSGGMELAEADIDEAWRGYCSRLRRRGFPWYFIETQAADLFAQAKMEMVEAAANSVEFYSPRGWLIECAWRRTINLLDKESRRPPLVSLDISAVPPKNEGLTPEEEILGEDQRRRVHEGVGRLLPEEQKIIELIYFQGMSCRRAAAAVGWSTSKADRWHAKALGRLRALWISASDL